MDRRVVMRYGLLYHQPLAGNPSDGDKPSRQPAGGAICLVSGEGMMKLVGAECCYVFGV